ncbi:transporter substrate-binding domain-containing protein [Paenibacillus sp. P26]|nr:transporter substrate-binding domain-containing protein [Paenibacillus sp. P26]
MKRSADDSGVFDRHVTEGITMLKRERVRVNRYGKKLTRLVTPLMASALMFSACSSASNESVMDRVKKSNVMKVGFEGKYEPFNMTNDKNEFTGYDVDISNEIAKRIGVKTQFIATDFDSLIGGLKADKFDIVIAQMTATEERKKEVDFTATYTINGATVGVKENSDIKGINDLKNKTIGAGSGTTFLDEAKKVEGAKVKEYNSPTDITTDLINGRIDAIIQDELSFAYQIKQHNLPIKLVGGVLYKDVMGMAVKKNNKEFLNAVDKALADMKKDGTLTAIYKKWFNIEPDPETLK